jgi:putative membrane protein
MKTINRLLLIATICSAAACNSGSNNDSVAAADSANAQNDTSDMVSDAVKDTMQAPVNDDVAKFAVKAANGGMAEVALGKLAEEKATNKKIKDFGAMMVKDHTKANDELKTLAVDKNITLPASVSDDMQKNIDDLSKESGEKFDKDYINMMVSDHKDDIDEFESEVKNAKDSAFKNFAVKTLPTLYKHLGSAEAIQKSNHY